MRERDRTILILAAVWQAVLCQVVLAVIHVADSGPRHSNHIVAWMTDPIPQACAAAILCLMIGQSAWMFLPLMVKSSSHILHQCASPDGLPWLHFGVVRTQAERGKKAWLESAMGVTEHSVVVFPISAGGVGHPHTIGLRGVSDLRRSLLRLSLTTDAGEVRVLTLEPATWVGAIWAAAEQGGHSLLRSSRSG